MIRKGNVTIGLQTRFGPDWTGIRCRIDGKRLQFFEQDRRFVPVNRELADF